MISLDFVTQYNLHKDDFDSRMDAIIGAYLVEGLIKAQAKRDRFRRIVDELTARKLPIRVPKRMRP